MTQKVHFNTFGGNPVASAIGLAVLEVIEQEQTQANSLALGHRLLAGLAQLKSKYPVIGDVRGQGLMLGLEFVQDRATKEPGREICAQVLENARELGLLLGRGGLWGQTIRCAPPMTITAADADFILAVLDAAIGAV
jgi:alanine-glyoxylate transaminase/(R)-3-amino-2-methylpropionate-pyruvate transaminase